MSRTKEPVKLDKERHYHLELEGNDLLIKKEMLPGLKGDSASQLRLGKDDLEKIKGQLEARSKALAERAAASGVKESREFLGRSLEILTHHLTGMGAGESMTLGKTDSVPDWHIRLKGPKDLTAGVGEQPFEDYFRAIRSSGGPEKTLFMLDPNEESENLPVFERGKKNFTVRFFLPREAQDGVMYQGQRADVVRNLEPAMFSRVQDATGYDCPADHSNTHYGDEGKKIRYELKTHEKTRIPYVEFSLENPNGITSDDIRTALKGAAAAYRGTREYGPWKPVLV